MQPNCPESLSKLQFWMGNLISSPFIAKVNDPFIESECLKLVRPTLKLKAHERMHIYHEQYWFRLFKILQENFPTLTRLFGYSSFNEKIASPYLLKYPSQEWTLAELGCKLPLWINENYFSNDREIVEAFSIIDRGVTVTFSASSKPSLTVEDLQDIKRFQLTLQPHVQLFQHPVNLFSFRDTLLEKPVNYWQENDFPELNKNKSFTILFRNTKHRPVWKELTFLEYNILKKFEKNSTLLEAIENENIDKEQLITLFKLCSEEKLFFKSL